MNGQVNPVPPPSESYAQHLALIGESIEDMNAGRTRPIRDVLKEIAARHSLPLEPGEDSLDSPPRDTYAQHLAILRESIASREAGDPGMTLEEVLASMDIQNIAIRAGLEI